MKSHGNRHPSMPVGSKNAENHKLLQENAIGVFRDQLNELREICGFTLNGRPHLLITPLDNQAKIILSLLPNSDTYRIKYITQTEEPGEIATDLSLNGRQFIINKTKVNSESIDEFSCDDLEAMASVMAGTRDEIYASLSDSQQETYSAIRGNRLATGVGHSAVGQVA
jgi:hypothetical protein